MIAVCVVGTGFEGCEVSRVMTKPMRRRDQQPQHGSDRQMTQHAHHGEFSRRDAGWNIRSFLCL